MHACRDWNGTLAIKFNLTLLHMTTIHKYRFFVVWFYTLDILR